MATLYGKSDRECSSTYEFIRYLTVEDIFTLQLLKFFHQWHKKLLPSIFDEPSICQSILTIPVMPQKATFIKDVLGPMLVRKEHQP